MYIHITSIHVQAGRHVPVEDLNDGVTAIGIKLTGVCTKFYTEFYKEILCRILCRVFYKCLSI